MKEEGEATGTGAPGPAGQGGAQAGGSRGAPDRDLRATAPGGGAGGAAHDPSQAPAAIRGVGEGPSLAVVVPAHHAADTVGRCLDGLAAAGFAPKEILVVDDGSPDGTGAIARARGVGVIRNDTPQRPARARNAGVAAVTAEVVVFVDADVVVHPDARARLLARFRADPELAAVFGSYDDDPPAPTLVGRYRNLLHHHVHQVSRTEAATFWTGFGAVRRSAYRRLGGLDPAWENIEDVEFGLRLSAAGGRIRLDPGLQATHLKTWTLRSMVLTDMIGRARPWTRLLRAGRAATGDLNTALSHRISAGAVALGGLGLLAAPAAPLALVLAGAGAGAFVAANRRFLVFLGRRHGWGFALACVPVHALHYAAAIAGYLGVVVLEAPPRRRGAGDGDATSR